MDVKLAALIWAEMVSNGIVPMTAESIGKSQMKMDEDGEWDLTSFVPTDVVLAMQNLSEEDKRRLKRCFRKLWRKARKSNKLWPRVRTGEPDVSMMRNRKRAVYSKFVREGLEEIKKSDPYYTPYRW